MKNVIYTGNFCINWEYYKGMQPWQIYNLYNKQKYCNKNNIDLKIIDNSNIALTNLYNNFRQLSCNKADAWNIGTLCSIIALEEFIISKYDNLCWIDLDVCILRNTNVFNYMESDLIIDFKNYCDGDKKYNKDLFVEQFLNLNQKISCSTGFMLMNKDGARKLINNIKSLGIDFNDDIFNLKLINFFEDKDWAMYDECIIEAVLNTGHDLNLNNIPHQLYNHIVYPGITADYTKDVFAYHFAGNTKYQIPEFWKVRNIE